jgi:hypothetical protein
VGDRPEQRCRVRGSDFTEPYRGPTWVRNPYTGDCNPGPDLDDALLQADPVVLGDNVVGLDVVTE